MSGDSTSTSTKDPVVLLVSVFIVAACALTYELLIATVSSYFLGSSVVHFSITIGLFMFFLGVGAFLSKFIHKGELEIFITTESLLGVFGGLSVLALQLSFSFTEHYYLTAFVLTGIIAILCGLEIPLLTRLLFNYQGLKNTIAHALSFDYVGGLIASIIFPLVLLPTFGTLKTAALVGLVNLAVATILIWEFRAKLINPTKLLIVPIVGAIAIISVLVNSERMSSTIEQALYDDDIILVEQSPYQKIILTAYKDDLRMYLNGDLQFSSKDEYRYHEPLVHIPMHLLKHRKNVLVLGGGDGLAARELLKYADVEKITVVDLDSYITEIAMRHALLRQLNRNSLNDPRVKVINDDAWNYIRNENNGYDLIIADLPDANDYSLGKLYSKEFYTTLRNKLTENGIFITQAASPYYTRQAFWCITHTLTSVFRNVKPLHNYVPSFGSWGYVIASNNVDLNVDTIIPKVDVRYLTPQVIKAMTVFDKDTAEVVTDINRLDNQLLVGLYAKGWRQWQ